MYSHKKVHTKLCFPEEFRYLKSSQGRSIYEMSCVKIEITFRVLFFSVRHDGYHQNTPHNARALLTSSLNNTINEYSNLKSMKHKVFN